MFHQTRTKASLHQPRVGHLELPRVRCHHITFACTKKGKDEKKKCQTFSLIYSVTRGRLWGLQSSSRLCIYQISVLISQCCHIIRSNKPRCLACGASGCPLWPCTSTISRETKGGGPVDKKKKKKKEESLNAQDYVIPIGRECIYVMVEYVQCVKCEAIIDPASTYLRRRLCSARQRGADADDERGIRGSSGGKS